MRKPSRKSRRNTDHLALITGIVSRVDCVYLVETLQLKTALVRDRKLLRLGEIVWVNLATEGVEVVAACDQLRESRGDA